MTVKCAEDLVEEEIIEVGGMPYEIRSVYISPVNGRVRIVALTIDESRTDFEIFLVFPPDALIQAYSGSARRTIIDHIPSLVLHCL